MQFEFEHAEPLIEAALDEFSERGFVAASINGILRRAGMSKGQFYYHFENKEALYLALVEWMKTREHSFVADALDPVLLDSNFFTILETMLEIRASFGARYPRLEGFSRSFFIREQGTELFERAIAPHRSALQDRMKQLVERAHKRGDFREDLPFHFVQNTLAVLFDQIPDLIPCDDKENPQVPLRHFLSFLRSGLGRPE